MNYFKIVIALYLLVFSSLAQAQLGFCTGSKGEPIFTENFGTGTNYGPPLPPGTTNYNFVAGTPNDGSYTLFYRTNLNPSWHYSLDRTPNDINGKALIVNADASTSGDFYRRVVTGLCVNTTFEFSAWVMNVYNPSSGVCGAGEIPVNVRFEIWNTNETVLLGAGNTGNIMGTFSPIWQQYALVFTTGSETSVVLKMKNNGVGGCGNDLAIDDIEFRACGELTTLSNPGFTGNILQVCENETLNSLNLQASTAGGTTYFYQWQSSTNGFTFTDIPGENAATYTAADVSSTTYFRVKVAQDVANLNNNFCSTISNTFIVVFTSPPTPPTSAGDVEICANSPIPTLSVTASATSGINWYDAPTGGNLLQSSNVTTFTPTAAGTYYAETFDLTSNCINTNRVAVTLSITPLPTASLSTDSSICPGNSTVVNFSGTPNAVITYTFNGGTNQFITLNGNGTASLTTPILNTDTTYTLVSVASPLLASCVQTLSSSVVIVMNETPSASVSGGIQVCTGDTGTVQFSGTPNATVTYVINNEPNQSLILNNLGEASISLSNLTTTTTLTLTEVSVSGANGCSLSLDTSTTFTLIPLSSATLTASSMTVCVEGTTNLTFTGTPNTQVTYTQNNGPNQTVDLNSNGTATITTPPITSTTTFQLVSATLLESPFCPQTLSESITITTNPIPTASVTGDLSYCSGETTALVLTSNLAGTTFTWTVTQNWTNGASAGSGDQINQLVTSTTTGSVIYTVTPSLDGCTGNPIQIEVVVHALPNPVLVDGAICVQEGSNVGNPYVLDTGLSTLDYSFEWYFEETILPNAQGSTLEANQIGTYGVVATDLVTGCISPLVTAEVAVASVGESLVIVQSLTFSNQPTITVSVVGGQGPFLYQLNDFGFQNSNVFYNVPAGVHTLTVVDESLCTFLIDTVTIINYLRFFTPNGDRFNDFWNITGVDDSSKIFIFDRYGKLLKQISPASDGWDGTYNGSPLPTNDYWFLIEYPENGILKTFKAHFSLKR
jgi:gliding motility-associated-like protein